MALIKAKDGGTVSIGSFRNGYPTSTTWGDAIRVPDPGIPLLQYDPSERDPLTIWKSQPSVRKVVGFAARQFASIPWHAYQRVDDRDRQRRSDSPLETLMENPLGNGLLTGYQFWETMAIDRMIYDFCLAVWVPGEGLQRIPPALVQLKSDHFGQLRQVLLTTPQGDDDLDVTDWPKILSFGWHANKSGGVTPMKTLAAILDENQRAVQWRAAQWENTPKMSGILKRPQDARKWDPTHRERFQKEWAAWKSSAKAGGTPILEHGMEYQQLDGLNPKDANDIEGRRLTDVEVASAFHIPPELVGAREGKYSSIDAFRQMLFGPTLGPMFAEMQQAVKIGGIIPAVDVTPGLYLEPNREAGMAGSFMEQARVFQTMTGGPVLTRAEARGRLNLSYIEGTDELIVPLNVIEGGQASPTDSGEQNVGGDNAEPEAREDTPTI